MSSISGSTSAPSSRCSTPSPMSGGSSSGLSELMHRPGDRVAGHHHQALGAEVERRLDRRVQARAAVEVPAARVRRPLDPDRREQQRDRGRRAHVLDARSAPGAYATACERWCARPLCSSTKIDPAPGARRRRHHRRACRRAPSSTLRAEPGPVDPVARGCRSAARGRAGSAAARRAPTAARRRSAGAASGPGGGRSAGSPRPWSAPPTARRARRPPRSPAGAAVAARNAALIAPTLVPTKTDGRSPRRSSSGSSTDSAPAS